MRGKVFLAPLVLSVIRITPAYAGKSGVQFFLFAPSLGSPPPMRGKERNIIMEIMQMGITPAYAGKRKNPEVVAVLPEDHPRLCGEKRQA